MHRSMGISWQISMPSDPNGYRLVGLWGSSATNVLAVGDVALHYDDTNWSPLGGAPGGNVVWGSSASDVFVFSTGFGCSGSLSPCQSNVHVSHYDGIKWGDMGLVTHAPLDAMWGSSGNDVFAVGLTGTILHYDVASWWETQASGTTNALHGVWSSATDVFAVGANGTILHRHL